jgi:hypothetical protein
MHGWQEEDNFGWDGLKKKSSELGLSLSTKIAGTEG